MLHQIPSHLSSCLARAFSISQAHSSLLNLVSAAATRRQLDQILACAIITSQLPANLPLATKLADRLASLRSLDAALSLLSSIPRPDLFLINVLIRSAALARRPSTALSLFSSLPCRDPPLNPDAFSYAFAMSAASSLASPFSGRALHARSIIDGFAADPFIGSATCDFYFKFSQVSAAEKVFDRISNTDTVCYNALISGLVNNSCFLRSLRVFERMVAVGVQLDVTTLVVVLPAAAELQDLHLGVVVHCLSVKLGVESRAHVVTGLISMYSKCGEVSVARFLFEGIDELDLITWNAMISGCSSNGHVGSSVGLFKELLELSGKPNSSTMVGLIPVFNPFGHESLSHSIHGFALKSGFDFNSSVSTALITVYARLNDMESARRLFDEMPDKTLASWNAMISGYAQNGLTELAISLFKEMQVLNVRPNPVTVTSILSACAQLGALTLGKWVHRMVTEEDLELNVFVLTALIDMYAKCGSIEEARRLFDGMAEKNVVSWNAMISGYGLHGQGCKALKLYQEMLNARIFPTGVTFLSILYACSHGGLVEEGRAIFQSMTRDHGVKPKSEHYACMVDLLGRAGQLHEALRFINAVQDDAGPGVWGALLGACMIHKEIELAHLASKRLFELEPENPGYYVLLSNIYSANQSYPEAAVVRQAVKNKKMEKTPGCTLIEIGEAQHIFTAGDRFHPQTEAIYSMLEELKAKMFEVGYHAETGAALYDVEEEEKQYMVSVHSEKLAIAFGLISTDPGSEIRIIKNLRVCLDCHSWTKFVSKVTERLIVVRDANRFHHFRDGLCSCSDYW